MSLAEDTVRDIASRYGGSGADEQPAGEPAALRWSGEAIAAAARGDKAAFLAAVRSMLEPEEAEAEYNPGTPGPGDFDPETLDPDLIPPE